MAVTNTARIGLPQWSAGTDPFTRAQMNAAMLAVEDHRHRLPHTFAIAGPIQVPAGDIDYIPGFFIPTPLPAGAVTLVAARHRINSGTSATVKLQRNGVDITGFTGISVTPASTTTDPADVALAAGDYIQLVVTAIAGSPKNLSLSVFLDYTAVT